MSKAMQVNAAPALFPAMQPVTAQPRVLQRTSLAVACGALWALAFQPVAWSWLGWIALVPLLLALDGVPLAAGAALGWLAGTAAGLGVCGYWMWRAAVDYFGLGAFAAAVFTFAVVEFFVAPYFAAFGAAAAMLQRGHRRHLLLIPAALVAAEFARVTLVGNAWALLGHSQRALILLQSASVTGVYGLSFLLALSATIVAEAWRQRAWRDPVIVWSRPALAALIGGGMVALAAVLGFGAWGLRHPPPATVTLTAALVQGNIANAERARAERAPQIIDRYLALTASLQPLAPLVIWPENAIPVFPDDNAQLITPIRTFLRRSGSALLAGAPRAGSRSGSAAIYNAAYLFTAERSAAVYDKQRLLPFVERFILRPGDTPYLAGSANLPIDRGDARLGVLICYEVIDAPLAADAIARGANLLVNLSNDSWFDAGAGPAQHYELARFRAVESGLALLRATNSGISGAFDASGRELIRLPPGVPAAAAVEVALVDRPSFYARHGDWFAASCVALTVLGLASIGVSARKIRRSPGLQAGRRA